MKIILFSFEKKKVTRLSLKESQLLFIKQSLLIIFKVMVYLYAQYTDICLSNFMLGLYFTLAVSVKKKRECLKLYDNINKDISYWIIRTETKKI